MINYRVPEFPLFFKGFSPIGRKQFSRHSRDIRIPSLHIIRPVPPCPTLNNCMVSIQILYPIPMQNDSFPHIVETKQRASFQEMFFSKLWYFLFYQIILHTSGFIGKKGRKIRVGTKRIKL